MKLMVKSLCETLPFRKGILPLINQNYLTAQNPYSTFKSAPKIGRSYSMIQLFFTKSLSIRAKASNL